MRKNFGAKPLSFRNPYLSSPHTAKTATSNAMNAAWGGISEMKEISICISAGHKTTANILSCKAFTASIAEAGQVPLVTT